MVSAHLGMNPITKLSLKAKEYLRSTPDWTRNRQCLLVLYVEFSLLGTLLEV